MRRHSAPSRGFDACCKLVFDSGVALVHGASQQGDLVEFLLGECQPLHYLGVYSSFACGVIGNMQQRTGGGDLEALAGNEREHFLQEREYLGQVCAPDIAPVDDSRDEDLIIRQAMVAQTREMFASPTNQIEADAIHRKIAQRLVAVANMTEIRLDQQLRRALVSDETLIYRAQS